MADLEKDINQTENPESTTPVIPSNDDFNLNLSDSEGTNDTSPSGEIFSNPVETSSVEWSTANVDFTESQAQPNLEEGDSHKSFLSDDSFENNMADAPQESNPIEWVSESNSVEAAEAPVENPVENLLKEPTNQSEVSSNPESNNNEIILWKFDNEMINTTEKEASIDHMNEASSPIWESNNQDREKAKLVQKEKLALLIKSHEAKAKSKWFTMWILSGILLTLAIMVVAFVFAKDQVLNLIDTISGSTSSTVIESSEINDDEIIDEEVIDDEISEDEEDIQAEDEEDTLSEDEEMEDIEIEGDNEVSDWNDYYAQVDKILAAWYDKETAKEYLEDILWEVMAGDEPDTELTTYISQSILNLTVNSSKETDDETDNSESNTQLSTEDEDDGKWYTIKHVATEEEANWVLPAHCSDLTCYGEDKEFTPCTAFRLAENLDENAHRIWSNWTCRYKDPSELVYVEIK